VNATTNETSSLPASRLRSYREDDPREPVLDTRDGERIASELGKVGFRFERWNAGVALPAGADQAAVLAAYAKDVERLVRAGGYQSVDVVRVTQATPNPGELRAKFLSEHVHSEDEVRFFVEGAGAFYLHVEGLVHQVICARGDLLSVPAGTRHWFDMGPRPAFAAIRFFDRPEGWVAQFTGDKIADRMPRFE
jgi:1,2-dihydroxy-3-keto-5-methylthiopentene dioxygenase